MSYWRWTYDSSRTDCRHISPQIISGVDRQRLLMGVPLRRPLPPTLRLRVPKGDEPIADFPTNWLEWPIVSDRLLNHLRPWVDDSVQVIEAPLYLAGARKRLDGYSILNAIRTPDCIDWERSRPMYFDGRLYSFDELCIVGERTQGLHVFRPKGATFELICSERLVKSLDGKGFSGLAFARCRCATKRPQKAGGTL